MSTTITSGAAQWLAENAAKAPHGNASASPPERARSASANLRDATITPVDLGYDPFPKQQQFHSSPAKYRLFGGAAGPGKSKALLMEAILQAHEIPGANTLLLRRTFSELEQSLLLYFRRDVPRELYKSYNDSKHVVTWHNNSTTRFGYCQSENDVYQYQGAEFLFIGIDELTLFTLRQWQFLTSRNRCPVPGAFPCMAAATNPGNIGHAWVKALWIDKQAAPGMENPGEYDPADYDFIPARVTDNPIYAADENYLKTLRALPSHLKRAFLDGDWDVFAGQYFDKFDFTRHVIRPELIDWKPWWPRWISIDWGFEHYAATYWHAAVPGNANLPIGASSLDRKTDAPSQVPAGSSALSSRAEGRSSSPAPASGAVGPKFEGSAVASNPAATSPAPTGRHSERSVPSSVLREAPGRAAEESLLDPAATSINDRREAPPSSPVGARYTVPGANTWRDVHHSPPARGDTLDVAATPAANIAAAAAPSGRHPERSAPVSSSVFAASANTPAHAAEGPLLDPAATSASNPASAGASSLSSRAEGRSSSPAPASGAVGPKFEGSAVASNPAATSAAVPENATAAANIASAAAPSSRHSVSPDAEGERRHSERSVPSSPSREAPGRAAEESLFDPAATSAPNPAAPPNVAQGFSPDTNDRAERASSSGGRSFSSDITDVREAPSSLPKAAAEGASPQRHASDAAASTAAPNPAAPSLLSCHPEPGRISGRCEGSAFSSASNAAPDPAAAIAEANRAREESSAKLPRRPRTWLGFAGTIPGTPTDAPASSTSSQSSAENSRCVISYREYVTHRTAPRELAREIVRRSVQSTPSPVGARYTVPGADTWQPASHPPRSRGDASSSVEDQGFLAPSEVEGSPDISDRAKRESSLGGRSFSSDINDRREAPIDLPGSTSRRPGSPSSLPKAPFPSSPRERTFFDSAPEKIDAIYLSPDAFARRTDEASIAEQMGDIFVAAGVPRPIPADDDRIGGWMLMYQMLDAGEWLLTENCHELIRTLPNLIRDPARIEDIEKMDGDDAADAARYGIKSRYGAHRAAGERRMPLADRLAARVVSDDPTIRAMQARKAQIEESRTTKPVKFPHRHRRPHR